MISVSKETDLERSKCFSRLYLNGSSCQAQPNKPKFTYSISSQTNYEFCDSYFSQFSEYRCVFFRLVVVVWVFVNVCVCAWNWNNICVCLQILLHSLLRLRGLQQHHNTMYSIEICNLAQYFVSVHSLSLLFISLSLSDTPSLPPTWL